MKHMRQSGTVSIWKAWTLAGCLLQLLAGCGTGAAPATSGATQAPGTIELNRTSSGDALVGGGGSGTVAFNGMVYRFAIGGLGVDGSAVAILATTGEVYQLGDIAQFPGTYRQASAGAPRPSQDSGGLWIQNEHGVIIHLRAPPQGQVPALHDDAVRVVMD
jgi:hypothetical protein